MSFFVLRGIIAINSTADRHDASMYNAYYSNKTASTVLRIDMMQRITAPKPDAPRSIFKRLGHPLKHTGLKAKQNAQ